MFQYARRLLFLFYISFIFSLPASAFDYANDPNGSYVTGLIGSGEFTSAHAELGGCPGKNPPHIYLDKFSGDCGCPTKPKIIVRGCDVLVSCDLDDDNNTVVQFKIPCPTIADSDPKYPLVKMLSGSLIEWNVSEKRVKPPSTITYGSKDSIAYGSEIFAGFDLDIVVSTVDTGKKWDIEKAESIVKTIEKHSRSNIDFALDKNGFTVEIMKPYDIYNAYKNRSPQVQAYLSLAFRGWSERPWTSYEKFINKACKDSTKPRICEKSLLGIEYLGRVGNYYLGNGNPTILGVYSEASSHTTHGASVTNDRGEPAFGIHFRSTFYVYFHASWVDHGTYGNAAEIYMGPSCIAPFTKTHYKQVCNMEGEPGHERAVCENVMYTTRHCAAWAETYGCVDDYLMSGTGQSREDCPECVKIYGWLDKKGKAHTEPFPISFYQSQPLLINENFQVQ